MIFWLIAIVTFSLDRLSKLLVQNSMEVGQSIPIIDGVFHLTYVENPGAAFGILAHRTNFFIVMTIIVILIVAYFYKMIPRERKLLKVALALQVGGALGNLADRILYGHVIDYFDFRVWPVFNIADSVIVAGVCLLAFEMFSSGGDRHESN